MSFIELSKIAGLSKFNARQTPDSDADCKEMCGSIREKGVTQPLTIRVEDGENRVLDGGRRYQALCRLREAGDFSEFNVPASFFEGSDEDAYELSLISFVQRKDLHPVDEFERFVELRDRFILDEEAIARRTGKSLLFVKQRLRYARLARAVRQAWREGRLTADQAHAFSATDNHEAQEALLNDPNRRFLKAADISRQLRGDDAIGIDDPRAIFVGLDAYAAAGGRLDEQLFEGDGCLFDEAILDRLAREKLEAEGERLCREEGWGWFETGYSVDDPYEAFNFFDTPEYSQEEADRLDAIDEFDGDDPEELARLEAEKQEIETRGMLRAVSRGDRATLGVFVEIDLEGAIQISRAARQIEPRTPAEPGKRDAIGSRSAIGGAPTPAPSDEGEKAAAIGKSTRAILDEAASNALLEVTVRNPRLALVFAVAALGCQYGAAAVCLKGEGWRTQAELESELLKEIKDRPFEKALAICARVELEDSALTPIAFAELVGRSIHTAQAGSFDIARILIAVASRFSDIDGALKRAYDYEAFFKSAPRGAAIETIRAVGGEAAAGEAAKLKKPELAARAALLAKDRAWLPETLASALELRAPEDERSTAKAMRDAIDADEARLAKERGGDGEAEAAISAESGERNDALDKLTRVDTFVELVCFRGNDALDAGKIKASELYSAFVEFCRERELKPLSLQEFGAAIAELGINKKRLKNGVHYLNLSIRVATDKAA